MISCLSDDAKNVNKKLGKISIRFASFLRNMLTMLILAEMLTRDPRVLPQEVIDAARKSRKRQPWEI